LRQGPRSLTVSARISLSGVTPFSTGYVTAFGSLDRGWHPSYGSADRRSFRSFGAYRERSRGCAQTSRAPSPHAVGFVLQPGQAESGHRFFHCRLCGLDSRDSAQVTLVSLGRMSSLVEGVGLLEAATVYRETTAGVACLPKLCAALRLKTFEAWPDARYGPVRGKAVNAGFVLCCLGAVISGPREPGAGGFVPSGYDLAARQRKRSCCRDVHNVE
jgi:hypothetical protein